MIKMVLIESLFSSSQYFFDVLGCFHHSVTLNPTDSTHHRLSNDHTSDSKLTPDRQFVSWEGMLNLPNSSLHTSTKVATIFQVNLTSSTPLCHTSLGLYKAQMFARILLPWLCWTGLWIWTDLTIIFFKMSHKNKFFKLLRRIFIFCSFRQVM